jgi:hypothetical protein
MTILSFSYGTVFTLVSPKHQFVVVFPKHQFVAPKHAQVLVYCIGGYSTTIIRKRIGKNSIKNFASSMPDPVMSPITTTGYKFKLKLE